MDLLRELFEQQKTSLDHFFQSVKLEEVQSALDALSSCTGTIVLTGVGKSGLVAQKIVATLVSTGTRACYLCPSNALHGDIGVLSNKASEDIVIAFSKSGQTQELLDLFPYIERKGAKTLAVVSAHGSRLEKRSDLTVHLPLLRELCPFDLVPTASTSIQLLFGDVLAIALMHKKQFSMRDFAANHPGGALGKMIGFTVADLMFKGDQIPFGSPSDKLLDMLHELSIKRCGCLVVVDEHRTLLGIFTDGDLRRSIRAEGPRALEKTLGELMTKTPKSIGSDRLAIDAVRVMEEDPMRLITVMPVLEGTNVVGLIRLHDILQTISR
jgi:arabinose-5-phosphate isomerase